MTDQDLRKIASLVVRVAAILVSIAGVALAVDIVLQINFYDVLYLSDIFDVYANELPGIVLIVTGIGLWIFHRPISRTVVSRSKKDSRGVDLVPELEIDSAWLRQFLVTLVALAMGIWGTTLIFIALVSFVGSSIAHGYVWNLFEENVPKFGLGVSLLGGGYILARKANL